VRTANQIAAIDAINALADYGREQMAMMRQEIAELRAQLAAAEQERTEILALTVQAEHDADELRHERDRLQIQVDIGYKIRRYVSFALTGNEMADVQLAADGTRAQVAELTQERDELLRARDVAIDLVHDLQTLMVRCGARF